MLNHFLPKLHLHRSFLACRPSKPPYTHIPPAPTAAEWLYRGLGPSPFHFILIHFEVSVKTVYISDGHNSQNGTYSQAASTHGPQFSTLEDKTFHLHVNDQKTCSKQFPNYQSFLEYFHKAIIDRRSSKKMSKSAVWFLWSTNPGNHMLTMYVFSLLHSFCFGVKLVEVVDLIYNVSK